MVKSVLFGNFSLGMSGMLFGNFGQIRSNLVIPV